MVRNKGKSAVYFAVFVVPALFLYVLFFIVPFIQGIGISFRKWDGLSQKIPIQMEKSEFETTILANIEKQADRDFILGVYTIKDGKNYSNSGVSGATRMRVERIMAKAGFVNPNNRFVGLDNYRIIFTGKSGIFETVHIDESFYPRLYKKTYFNETSELPDTIAKKEYNTYFLKRLSPEQRTIADEYYALQGDNFVLAEDKRKANCVAILDGLPELAGIDASAEVEDIVKAARDGGLSGDRASMETALSGFFSLAAFSPESKAKADEAAWRLFDAGRLRMLMGQFFYEDRMEMGVLGFTVFFAVMLVVIGNLLAFLLALALDTKIRSKNVLRSVFFIPNVLSMIVVALIWSIMFMHLLPAITGISAWMSDLNKSPWLIVTIAAWQAAGYYMVIYLAGLQNIPSEIVEAAKIDGAGWWHRLRAITIPMMMPAFTICLFLSTANALKSFDLMWALSNGSAKTLGVLNLVMDIYLDAYMRKSAGLAAAKAVILFGVIFAITGVQLRMMNKKEIQL